MREAAWVEMIAEKIRGSAISHTPVLRAETHLRLPYGYEILEYGERPQAKASRFQTDLAIVEDTGEGGWKPRVVIEAKVRRISTHDAITYSQKAAAHRAVHPYLRYGVMLGARSHWPLPGRLYRHGTQFDFMISFVDLEPDEKEMIRLVRLVQSEIEASRRLESMIYDSRKADRDRYTFLQRRLALE